MSTRPVLRLVASPCGRWLAAGYYDVLAHVIDCSSRSVVAEVPVAQRGGVLGFDGAGSQLLVWLGDGRLGRYDLASAKLHPLWAPSRAATAGPMPRSRAAAGFLADGRILAVHPDGAMCVGPPDPTVVPRVLRLEEEPQACTISPSGTWCAVALGSTVHVIDASTFETRCVLPAPPDEKAPRLRAVGDTRLAVAGRETSIQLWDPLTGAPRGRLLGLPDHTLDLASDLAGDHLAVLPRGRAALVYRLGALDRVLASAPADLLAESEARTGLHVVEGKVRVACTNRLTRVTADVADRGPDPCPIA